MEHWSFRPATEKELLKLDEIKQNGILLSAYLYFAQREKFIYFDIAILIQQGDGDRHSLLKKGIYFNFIQEYNKPNLHLEQLNLLM